MGTRERAKSRVVDAASMAASPANHRKAFGRRLAKIVQFSPALLLILILLIEKTVIVGRAGLSPPPSSSKETASGLTINEQPASSRQTSATRHSRRVTSGVNLDELDPMEPCYLANNRASETLTISESTPVGTVVGEIMVIGDLGNIELSIRMPGGGGGNGGSHSSLATATAEESSAPASTGLPGAAATGAQPLQSATSSNGYYSAPARRTAGQPLDTGQQQQRPTNHPETRRSAMAAAAAATAATGSKSVRDLSEKIDLMPPLSLEQGTKRLILAKKLDRENLDKYAQLAVGGGGGSLSQQSTSASLTVHVKCQLKSRRHDEDDAELVDSQQLGGNHADGAGSNSTAGRAQRGKTRAITGRPQVASQKDASSILIPVHLIITDENDNWPRFSAGPYIIDLNESAPVGSLLQNNEILAHDDDQPGPLSTIEYSIVPGSFYSDTFAFLNPLDSRSLIVRDNRLLDYESQPKITLRVMARDQGDPANWAITSLYVNLLDQDDMNPAFNEDKYTGVVRENRPGEKIDLLPRRMVAHDGDRSLLAPIVYSFYIKTNHSIHFDLDPDLGQLTVKKTLPELGGDDDSFHAQPFCLLIKATQADNPRRSTLTAVSLRMGAGAGQMKSLPQSMLLSNSDSPSSSSSSSSLAEDAQILSFAQGNFTVELSEAATVGSTVFIARTNHRHGTSYQLLDNDLGYFEIDQDSGRLTLNKSLDYEMFRHLSVRILATAEMVHPLRDPYQALDRINRTNSYTSPNSPSSPTNNYPRLACDITRINVIVVNHNDYAPEFSHEQYNFQLSISDLIANFEPDSNRLNDNHQEVSSSVNEENIIKRINHGFGNQLANLMDQLDDDNDGEKLGDNFKALALGQVFCADRDFNDKLSLQLVGTRANLFHLTQDGRLYLPLINSSSHLLTNHRRDDSPSRWNSSPGQTATINNQYVMNRIFASSRRSDSDQRQPGATQLDRAHLNYLLSELSNLGRLRLKVVATDSGQPEAKRSTALIVISIISIDNFIIQRWPQSALLPSSSLASHQDSGEPVPLTNSTSYQTVTKTEGHHNQHLSTVASQHHQDKPLSNYAGQLMMISSNNGKSFVQVNPDIIGNLLLPTTQVGNYSLSSKTDLFGDKFGKFSTSQRSSPDLLDSSASNTVSNTIELKEGSTNQATSQINKYQPPGLLLVDDDGAKFVAMPAAIEVYNQQVQEAADQQARQKSQRQNSEPDKRPTSWFGHIDDGAGAGHSLTTADSAGFMKWVNISTAVALHLIVVVCILSLVIRLRAIVSSSFDQTVGCNNNNNNNNQSDSMHDSGANSTTDNRWPRRISNWSAFFVDKQAANILDRHQAVSSQYSSAPPDITDPQLDHYRAGSARQFQRADHYYQSNALELPHSQQQGSPTNNRCRQQQQAIVSSGLVVSARSNVRAAASHEALAEATSSAAVQPDCSIETRNQQNLFEHLKVTLNKMLDGSREDTGLNQVTIRPLDSDVVNFEDQRDRQLELRAQSGEALEMARAVAGKHHYHHQLSSRVSPSAKSPISTFVGTTPTAHRSHAQAQSSPLSSDNNQSGPATSKHPTVVSINVAAPKHQHQNGLHHSAANHNANSANKTVHSSNSSVVSLISGSSSSSSLSNKISKAIAGANSQASASDSTSLNSSILLQGCASSSTTATTASSRSPATTGGGGGRAAMPPAPPPLPPPPSLVRASVQQDGQRGGHSRLSASRHLESPRHSPCGRSPAKSGLVVVAPAAAASPQATSCEKTTRRLAARPENPTHLQLRRDAVVDQLISDNCPPSSRFAIAEGEARTSPRKPLVGGRREARNQQMALNGNALAATDNLTMTQQQQQQQQRHSFKSAVSLDENTPQPQQIHPVSSSSASASPPSNKTISPSTSVDRGYESFQSFGFQQAPPPPPATSCGARQFSSLQECTRSCISVDCEQEYATSSLPVEEDLRRRGAAAIRDSSRRGWASTRGGDIQAGDLAREKRRSGSQVRSSRQARQQPAAGRPNDHHEARSQMVRGSEVREFASESCRPDCDTEDDDFYYYCAESVHADEHQLGCLSYSNHTYQHHQQQQQPAQHQHQSASSYFGRMPSRKGPKRVGGGGKRSSDLSARLSSGGGHHHQFGGTQSQFCDIAPLQRQQGRRGQGQNLGRAGQPVRSQPIGQSSHSMGTASELGVKKLTWSDQVAN